MSIRTNLRPGTNPFPSRRQRKIDQAYELAGMARMDGDDKDAQKWMDEVKRLRTCDEDKL